MASKYNPFVRIQKWMDTFAGQTFMQYAYSWGAAVVILGALFKLIHVDHADVWLIVGMGTEVFVFFVAAFERVTEKVPETEEQTQPQQGVVYGGVIGAPVVGGAPIVGGAPSADGVPVTSELQGDTIGTDGPVVVGGGIQGGVIYTGAPVVSGGPVMAGGPVVAGGPVLSAGVAGEGGETVGVDPAVIKATDPSSVEEAVKNYTEELIELTDVLGRVKDQAARMSTDSEEMENLNRTLTGIATVYELQLRNISKQVSTIEEIDEQTKRMAKQIEELNNVYARMIAALTVNMGGGAAPVPPVAPVQGNL